MARYIDADDFYKALKEGFSHGTRTIKEMVDDIPTADVVEIKRGEWLKRKMKQHQFVQNGYELYYCSVCNKNYNDISGFDFCPNCGADMRGEKK